MRIADEDPTPLGDEEPIPPADAEEHSNDEVCCYTPGRGKIVPRTLI